MADIAIIYATREGQTQRIAEHMARPIRAAGHQALVLDFRELYGGPPPAADGIIIGASVHVGHHPEELESWVREHREALESRFGAFFSVSLSATGARVGAKVEAGEYITDFLNRTGWHPDAAAAFAGALRYTRYGWFKRLLMKFIASRSGSADLDTRRDYEYTDWEAVERFATESVHSIETKAG
jgi:menaquinone-dependent protoporphyrinogen oxidase